MDRYSRVMPTRDPGVRMNDNIRATEIRVIDDDGQVGVMSPREAMEIARQRGVDLIEIVPNAQPPVCKLIDFGKFKYEQQKRDKTAKKTTHQQLIKEVRFHPSTDTHDFDFKLRHARGFLEEGHKVKATVQFKGREVAYRQFGEELLKKFSDALVDLAKVDQEVSMMGRMMTMMLSPLSKKKKEEPKEKKDRSDEPKTVKPRTKKPAIPAETSELGEKLHAAVDEAELEMAADDLEVGDVELEELGLDDLGLEDIDLEDLELEEEALEETSSGFEDEEPPASLDADAQPTRPAPVA